MNLWLKVKWESMIGEVDRFDLSDFNVIVIVKLLPIFLFIMGVRVEDKGGNLMEGTNVFRGLA